MTEALYTFTPNHSSDQVTFWSSIAITVVAIFLTVRMLKRQEGMDYNRRMLLAMLFFFGGIIAAGTAFFSGWSMYKQGTVYLYEDAVRIGEERFAFTDIRRMVVKEDKGQSFVNPQITTRTTRILLIELKNGHVFALSEEQYPLADLLGRLKEIKGD